MDKPRIFLGSSVKQEELLEALTRGLEDIARCRPLDTSFNPGTTTLERLVELAHEVDFAAFSSLRMIGRPRVQQHPLNRNPVKLLRETMSFSKPDFLVEHSE